MRDDGLFSENSDKKFCEAYIKWVSRLEGKPESSVCAISTRRLEIESEDGIGRPPCAPMASIGLMWAGLLGGSAKQMSGKRFWPAYRVHWRRRPTPSAFPAWLMINGERTDKGCNSMDHDFEVLVARGSPALLATAGISDQVLCRRINDYFDEQAERAREKLADTEKADAHSAIVGEEKSERDEKKTMTKSKRRRRKKKEKAGTT